MDFEIWTIHYDFKKVLHVLIIIYILYVLKHCLYAMLLYAGLGLMQTVLKYFLIIYDIMCYYHITYTQILTQL